MEQLNKTLDNIESGLLAIAGGLLCIDNTLRQLLAAITENSKNSTEKKENASNV